MDTQAELVTKLLNLVESGDRDAESRLAEIVYEDLHRIAARHMRGERIDHTLQATALVHEAYVELLGRKTTWKDRVHFYAAAAQSIRRILVDYARKSRSEKRGGGRRKVTLDDMVVFGDTESDELLIIHEALDRLAQWDARQARIVELRFFTGLSEEEIADILNISSKTVQRDWAMARAWLQSQLSGNRDESSKIVK
jgi:RNA polymerase sigma factor (TIGR02999 family)